VTVTGPLVLHLGVLSQSAVPTDKSHWEKSFRLLTFWYFDLIKIIQKCQLSPLSSLRERRVLEDEIEIWDVVPRARHTYSTVFNQSRASSVESCGTFGWGSRFCCRLDQLIVRAPLASYQTWEDSVQIYIFIAKNSIRKPPETHHVKFSIIHFALCIMYAITLTV